MTKLVGCLFQGFCKKGAVHQGMFCCGLPLILWQFIANSCGMTAVDNLLYRGIHLHYCSTQTKAVLKWDLLGSWHFWQLCCLVLFGLELHATWLRFYKIFGLPKKRWTAYIPVFLWHQKQPKMVREKHTALHAEITCELYICVHNIVIASRQFPSSVLVFFST